MRLEDRTWPLSIASALVRLAPGAAFKVPANLFQKISDADAQAWGPRSSQAPVTKAVSFRYKPSTREVGTTFRIS